MEPESVNNSPGAEEYGVEETVSPSRRKSSRRRISKTQTFQTVIICVKPGQVTVSDLNLEELRADGWGPPPDATLVGKYNLPLDWTSADLDTFIREQFPKLSDYELLRSTQSRLLVQMPASVNTPAKLQPYVGHSALYIRPVTKSSATTGPSRGSKRPKRKASQSAKTSQESGLTLCDENFDVISDLITETLRTLLSSSLSYSKYITLNAALCLGVDSEIEIDFNIDEKWAKNDGARKGQKAPPQKAPKKPVITEKYLDPIVIIPKLKEEDLSDGNVTEVYEPVEAVGHDRGGEVAETQMMGTEKTEESVDVKEDLKEGHVTELTDNRWGDMMGLDYCVPEETPQSDVTALKSEEDVTDLVNKAIAFSVAEAVATQKENQVRSDDDTPPDDGGDGEEASTSSDHSSMLEVTKIRRKRKQDESDSDYDPGRSGKSPVQTPRPRKSGAGRKKGTRKEGKRKGSEEGAKEKKMEKKVGASRKGRPRKSRQMVLDDLEDIKGLYTILMASNTKVKAVNTASDVDGRLLSKQRAEKYGDDFETAVIAVRTKQMKCRQASEKFNVPYAILWEEVNKSRFRCNICDKKFAAACHMRRHLSKHVESRNYKCEQCSKSFNCTENLKRHQVVHSKKHDHVCETCGETFLWKASLNRHLMKHSGDRPHTCSMCPKTFITIHDLKAHVKLHTGIREFICSECGMQFARSSGLNAHTRTAHNELRTFKCTECGKGFKMKHALDRHMRNHTGKEVYTCGICGQGFKWYTSRKLHMKKHAKDGVKLTSSIKGPGLSRTAQVSMRPVQEEPLVESNPENNAVQHTLSFELNQLGAGDVAAGSEQQQRALMESVVLTTHPADDASLPRVSVAQVPIIGAPGTAAMLDHAVIQPVIISPMGVETHTEGQKIYIDFHQLQPTLKPLDQPAAPPDVQQPQ